MNPVMRKQGENTMVTFSLGVNGRKNKDGTRETMFIDCVICGRQAELASQYVTKGTLITLVGRLYQSRYNDRNGLQHSKIALMVDEFELYGKPESETPEKPKEDQNGDSELPF